MVYYLQRNSRTFVRRRSHHPSPWATHPVPRFPIDSDSPDSGDMLAKDVPSTTKITYYVLPEAPRPSLFCPRCHDTPRCLALRHSSYLASLMGIPRNQPVLMAQ